MLGEDHVKAEKSPVGMRHPNHGGTDEIISETITLDKCTKKKHLFTYYERVNTVHCLRFIFSML
jgi:hypothetical protein